MAGGTREVQAVLDAQRSELFVGRFEIVMAGEGSVNVLTIKRLAADAIVPRDKWLAGLESGVFVTGTGLNKVEGRLPADVLLVPAESREPRAAVVGQIAWRDYVAGRRDDLWKLAPVYLRASYAEEKAKTKV